MSTSNTGVNPTNVGEHSKRPGSKMASPDDPFREIENEHGEPFIDWKHPLNLHPWYFAHQALRVDFEDNLAILDKMISAIEIGVYCRYFTNFKFSKSTRLNTLLLRWMTHNYMKFTALQLDFMHHHHEMEDKVIFPLMATKMAIDPNIGKDHQEVAIRCNLIDKKTKALLSSPNLLDSYKEIRVEMVALRDVLEPHLQEEELKWLPALLRKFTKDEISVVERPATRDLPWATLPHYYRRLSKAERESHMIEIFGMPRFVVIWILAGNFKKYDDIYRSCINELMNPDLREENMRSNSSGCVIA